MAGTVRIGPTALFTAQTWVAHGFEHSEHFDTPLGRLLYYPTHWTLQHLGQRAPSLHWHEQFLVIRHAAVEQALRQLQPSYVLEVGAGLSPRGLAWATHHPNSRYVEADLPSIVATKRRLLRHVPLPSNYRLTVADLLDRDFLSDAASRPRVDDAVGVVTEGVTDYLDMEQKRRAYENIASLLRKHGGGKYVLDVYTRKRLRKYPLSAGAALAGLSLLIGGDLRSRLFQDATSAIAFLISCGFASVRSLDVNALNCTAFHPPDDHRHFDLLECEV